MPWRKSLKKKEWLTLANRSGKVRTKKGVYMTYLKIVLLFILCINSNISFANNHIPAELFAKVDYFGEVAISPNGKYIAFETTDANDEHVVVVMDLDSLEVMSTMHFVGDSYPVEPVWLNNDRILTNVARKSSYRNKRYYTGEIFTVAKDGSKDQWLVQHQKSSVTTSVFKREVNNDLTGYAELVTTLPSDPHNVLISHTPSGTKYKRRKNSVYRVSIKDGRAKLVVKAPMPWSEILFDSKGLPHFAWAIDETNKNLEKVFKFEGDKWVEHEKLTQLRPELVSLSSDAEQLYFTSYSKEGHHTLSRLNTETNEIEELLRNDEVELEGIAISDQGNPFAVFFEPNYADVALIQPKHRVAKWIPALYKAFPNKRVVILDYDKKQTRFLFSVSADRLPTEYYYFDVKHKKYKRIYGGDDRFKGFELAESIPISYAARDKVNINGYLTLPNGKEADLPMIVIPHGGPRARDYWQYNRYAQFLANRGYAVLQTNFRGSSGYGERFEALGNREWGRNIQFDILDGIQWAKNVGVANDNVCILGGSFGGYSALRLAEMAPETVKCAVGIAGVYNLELMWSEGSIRKLEVNQNYLREVIGEDENTLKSFSPVNAAHRITSPVLLIHGEEDQRVPLIHYEQMLASLESANKEVEGLVLLDETHGLFSQENGLKVLTTIEKFLDKHLN